MKYHRQFVSFVGKSYEQKKDAVKIGCDQPMEKRDETDTKN
jgi:hypothetical protein